MKVFKVFLKNRINNKRVRKVYKVEKLEELLNIVDNLYLKDRFKPLRTHLIENNNILKKYKFTVSDNNIKIFETKFKK